MYEWVKPLLFRLDPETAHEWTVRALAAAQRVPGALAALSRAFAVSDTRLSVRRWGLRFPNPVGLAAGFDKNAAVFPALAALGFGFVEVGTLTPRPQPGNPRPRLFRLPEDEAVINRMGFNNRGAEAAARSLARHARTVPIGVNIGKNKDTPNEAAVDDYRRCLRALYAHGDYFVVNVSSPNTPGLRALQHAEALARLLEGVLDEARALARETGAPPKPILVKLAPDLDDGLMREIARAALDQGVAGFVATNTTVDRSGLNSRAHAHEAGGLSGRPLEKRATEAVRLLYRATEGRVPIIGVGGVFDGAGAYAKIRAGASLVQVYTGLIYRGPAIARRINRELLALLQRDGLSSLEEAVGADA
ncbi:quinone-dependent dihydroorotate dehydrogenase [Calditerricola satsumensis]|uniref:Dihydroorotate dehydrogenase (quinone) n=1 Tax=Calditerricola satsumensis TaxID=373054 RepID=A0A8J3FE54_9BACI|nr:quinone-dependent dihydroorotate dehydrogenase [Calditerricola satsumensis]GGJ98922.1 dihydroorotate dehydrogenase (quinone) [Calditerricola satsumensis]